MNLLFVSNLFPDQREPYRGLDNATILHQLRGAHHVEAIGLRPVLPFRSAKWSPRELDIPLAPLHVGVPYVPKLGSFFNHRLIANRLRPIIRERLGSFDVVLASWIFPDCCAIAALGREFGFPFVAIAQGSDIHQYLEMPVRKRIILSAMQRASGVITRSGDLAGRLKKAGIPSDRLHPIYNGVDFTTFFPGPKEQARKAIGLPETGKVILFVGNFFEIKNPFTLLRAVEKLGPATTLVLVGGGPLEAEMRKVAGKNVIFAGRKNAAEVAGYMRAADLLCLPSWNEGVPNVILEALASGLPVVASRVGGIPEIIREPFLGRLIDPASTDGLKDALEKELAAPDRTGRIAEFGKQFQWTATASQYQEVLESAIRSFSSDPSDRALSA